MPRTDGKTWAINQLKAAAAKLGTLPLKSDFDPVTLSRIKAFLGPWPRALETAGLKPPRPPKKKNIKNSGNVKKMK